MKMNIIIPVGAQVFTGLEVLFPSKLKTPASLIVYVLPYWEIPRICHDFGHCQLTS